MEKESLKQQLLVKDTKIDDLSSCIETMKEEHIQSTAKHTVCMEEMEESITSLKTEISTLEADCLSEKERNTELTAKLANELKHYNDIKFKDEIERISPKLVPAVTRDIADKGDAIAETVDAEQSNDAATQLMTLLLASSLSRAVGGRIGLSESEIIEFHLININMIVLLSHPTSQIFRRKMRILGLHSVIRPSVRTHGWLLAGAFLT